MQSASPTTPQNGGSKKKLYIGLTAGVVIVVIIVILALVFTKKSDSSTATNTATNGSASNPVSPDTATVPAFIKFDKSDIPGLDMPGMPIKADNFEACSGHCDERQGCSFFAYDTSNGNCWLKGTSGDKNMSKTMWKTSLSFENSKQINGDIPGFDRPGMPKQVDLKGCYNLCKDDSSCQWINWNTTNNCWLKQSATHPTAQIGLRTAGEKL